MELDEAAREIESAGDVLDEESAGTETEGSENENGNEKESPEGGVKDERGKEEEAQNKEDEKQTTLPDGPDATEIAKIEAKIELLKENRPDMKQFYSQIENYLSEEELALRFDEDQSAYIEAVERAKEKFIAEHSSDDEIAKLTEQLETKKREAQIIDAVRTVVEEFPDYDHERIGDFFQNDLTRREQEELQANARDYADFFKGVYKKWKERNPGKVETVKAPDIPDLSKAAKEPVGYRADTMFGDEEQEYLAAVGFRKI